MVSVSFSPNVDYFATPPQLDCLGRPRPRRSVAERFFERVQKSNSCWAWIGSKSGGRLKYGRFQLAPKVAVQAHRMAWVLANGLLPTSLDVLHACDNPLCVNPEHLFLGTQTDNMRDMAAKKRHPGHRKTHCVNGHPFEGNRSQPKKGRYSYCMACRWRTDRPFINRGQPKKVGTDTHCAYGHIRTPENTKIAGRWKLCRVCTNESVRRYQERKKAAQAVA